MSVHSIGPRIEFLHAGVPFPPPIARSLAYSQKVYFIKYRAILVPKRTRWQNILDFKRFLENRGFLIGENVPFFVYKISNYFNEVGGIHEGTPVKK
jgi:hypothetical protein